MSAPRETVLSLATPSCRLLIVLIAGLAMLSLSPSAYSVGLEKLVMPGRVIEGHADIEGQCGACHDSDSDQASAELCVSCHEDIGSDRSTRQGFHGQFETARASECIACHSDHEGRDADIVALNAGIFDHDLSDFRLLGSHASVSCADCHAPQEKHRSASNTCGSCHAEDDVHAGELGVQCESCHNQSDWRDYNFDHSSTDYLLTGKHVGVECVDCHRGNQFSGTERTCNSCHAIDDAHRGSNGTDCGSCHSTTAWLSIDFDHLQETGFSLTDGHGGLVCQDCHSQEDFGDDFSAGCAACHSTEDDHQGRNGTQCGDCHKSTTWPDTLFEHADTGFTLHDSHASVGCVGCHKAEVEESLPTTCSSCHVMDNPHGSEMQQECSTCHLQTSWIDSIAFDHDLSNFPLTGLHATAACGSCHESNQFSMAPTDCGGCHAEDDVHAGSLGANCAACHTSNAWMTTVFDHDLHTDFKLEGGHDGLVCTACHAESEGAQMSDVPQSCGGCHATDDPHDRQFGVQCGDCHNTTDFAIVEQL